MGKKDRDEDQKKEGGLIRRETGLSPFADFDRFFDEALGGRWPSLFRRDWPAIPEMRPPFEGRWPKVDVIDREAELVVRAELPGVKKEDLEVTMTDNTVTIKASTQTEKEEKEEKGQYFRRETSRGEFVRTVPLPAEVNGEGTKAVFKDGVLELTMPKVKKSPRKSVKVE
jgi:HSP20 family protein